MIEIEVHDELKRGGEWLGAGRQWLQNNVVGGDRMCWSDATLVQIPFRDFEKFALTVATAAVVAERKRKK